MRLSSNLSKQNIKTEGKEMSKKLGLLLIVGLLLLSFGGIAAKPAPEEIDKVVFVHYPQGSVPYWSPSKAPAPTDESTRYKYTGIHWATPYVEYAVNPADAPEGAGNAIEAALDTWEAAPGDIMFVRQDDTALSGSILDGNNVVSWENISGMYPGAIAVTVVWYYRGSKEMVDVDTVMNSVDPWSVNTGFMGNSDTELGDPSAYDVQNIMTHEAGHWLMLEDLYQWKTQKLTMYGYGALGELQKRTLGVGDELGINRIY